MEPIVLSSCNSAPPLPPTLLLSHAKPSIFQCLLRLGPQNVSGRRLGLPNWSCLGVFDDPGGIKSIALLILGDQFHQKRNVFLHLGNTPLENSMFGLPLTSKSKRRTPETRSTLRSKLRCTRFSRKFGVHWAPCHQNDPVSVLNSCLKTARQDAEQT